MKERAKLFEQICDIIVDWSCNDIKELAEKAEVSDSTLFNWVYGKTMNPHINTIVKVADALGFELILSEKRATKLRLVV